MKNLLFAFLLLSISASAQKSGTVTGLKVIPSKAAYTYFYYLTINPVEYGVSKECLKIGADSMIVINDSFCSIFYLFTDPRVKGMPLQRTQKETISAALKKMKMSFAKWPEDKNDTVLSKFFNTELGVINIDTMDTLPSSWFKNSELLTWDVKGDTAIVVSNQLDTIPVIVVACDTAPKEITHFQQKVNNNAGFIFWLRAYQVGRKNPCFDRPCFTYGRTDVTSEYFNVKYLDSDKKPLEPSIIIWMSKKISQ